MTLPSGYRIGKVSKLTGISADTLRIWERRYAAVTPVRTSAGGRIYSAEDIARLKLIKSLVDGGDSIGNVATLTVDDLQARVDETEQVAVDRVADKPIKTVVVGTALTASLHSIEHGFSDIEIVGTYPSVESFQGSTDPLNADIVIVERSTVHEEMVLEVNEWLRRANAAHVVVVYRFASHQAIEKLPGSKSSTLKLPVTPETIHQHIVSLLHHPSLAPMATSQTNEMDIPAPARRYSDEALAKISTMSPVIKCECPHHLAELIASLAAFEQYSSECENRSLEDAELHGYLSRTASHARHLIENALEIVIEIEKIEV